MQINMKEVTVLNITLHELQILFETSLNKFLIEIQEIKQEKDEWFNVAQLCDYLPEKPTINTVYGWVHLKKIPHHRKNGIGRLTFLKSEIDLWQKEGLRKTGFQLKKEIELTTDSYLETTKKRRQNVK
jgi:hypothetical protein